MKSGRAIVSNLHVTRRFYVLGVCECRYMKWNPLRDCRSRNEYGNLPYAECLSPAPPLEHNTNVSYPNLRPHTLCFMVYNVAFLYVFLFFWAAHIIIQPFAISLQPFKVCILSLLGTHGHLYSLNRLASFPAPSDPVTWCRRPNTQKQADSNAAVPILTPDSYL